MTFLLEWLQHNTTQIVLTLIVGLVCYAIFNRFGKRVVTKALLKEKTVFGRKNHQLSQDEKLRIETISGLVNRIAQAFILVVLVSTVLKLSGVDIGPLLAGAGLVGILIGLGTQSVVRDLLAGLFIVFENQFAKGDIIRVNTLSGKVVDLSLRITVLRDDFGVEHIIPNGQITSVSNLTKYWSAINFTVPVDYEQPVEPVIKLIQTTIDEMMRESDWQNFFLETPVVIAFDDFTSSHALIRIRGKVLARQQWQVAYELRRRIFIAAQQQAIKLG